jgi:hypothetical protein
MQEVSASAGRGKRGSKLLGDVPCLAHAGEDQIAFEAVNHPHGAKEINVELYCQGIERARFNAHHFAAKPQDFRFGKYG